MPLCSHWQDDSVGAYRGLLDASRYSAAGAGRAFVPRVTYREVTWLSLPSAPAKATPRQVIAIFTRELQAPALNYSDSSRPYVTHPPLPINPVPAIPVCSRTIPPFVTGLCFDAPLVCVPTVSPAIILPHVPSGTTALICLRPPVSLMSTALLCKFHFFLWLQSRSNLQKHLFPATRPASTSAMCRRLSTPSTLEHRPCPSPALLWVTV